MACSSQTSAPTLRTVTISYSELKDKNADLSMKIEEGFGPTGLGILSITDVPEFPTLRKNLLNLSSRLASLPEEVKKELEDPRSRYNIGWSHGKEQLESGKPDLLKGSFYANPLIDVPTTDAYLIERYPAKCGANIWPQAALPELEVEGDFLNVDYWLYSVAFKALGKLIVDVGMMVAYHCDQYVSKGVKMHEHEGLEHILLRSRCHKGRLLYYFPANQRFFYPSTILVTFFSIVEHIILSLISSAYQGNYDVTCSDHEEDGDSMSSWCGWHRDHGSLTGLTCAMFKRDGVEISCPDSAAGLYIRTRTGQIVKAIFGEDEIAYQIGETTEILSRGYLCATPHCVRAPKGKESAGVDRSTSAFFMNPDWDEKLNFPEEVHIHKELIPSKGTLTFGEYSEMLYDKYYYKKT